MSEAAEEPKQRGGEGGGFEPVTRLVAMDKGRGRVAVAVGPRLSVVDIRCGAARRHKHSLAGWVGFDAWWRRAGQPGHALVQSAYQQSGEVAITILHL
jgi:hypothetical protein